jgi:hypothetical protein
MSAIVCICPYCEADVMIHPRPVNQCPFCNCLFTLIKNDGDYEEDQIYSTRLLKEGNMMRRPK